MFQMFGALVRSFGDPKTIQIFKDLVKPKISTATQVLVKVEYCGVNPVDTYIRSGQYAKLPELPYTPQRDGSGIVQEIGSAVDHVSVGDRVWFCSTQNGAAAEYCITEYAYKLDDDLSFAQGACLGIPYMTAYRSLFGKANLKPGARIFVHGASGSVGLAACQLAVSRGFAVVGSAGSSSGVENVRRMGVTSVVNHRDDGYVEQLMKEYPNGFDLILEMNAHLNLNKSLKLVARNGSIAIIGNRGEIKINPRDLMVKESSIFGVALNATTDAEYHGSAKEINELIAKCKLRPIINTEYSLENLPKAHDDVISGRSANGQIVVRVQLDK